MRPVLRATTHGQVGEKGDRLPRVHLQGFAFDLDLDRAEEPYRQSHPHRVTFREHERNGRGGFDPPVTLTRQTGRDRRNAIVGARPFP